MTFDINGQTRGFKLGTYTFKLINELAGTKTIEDVFKGMQSGDVNFIATFYYACAKHHAMSNKQPIDFAEVDVCDWLDELGADETGRITTELIRMYATKNAQAPTKQTPTGQEVELQSSNGMH
jgi:hypothetical protein